MFVHSVSFRLRHDLTADDAAHDAYHEYPIHDRFRETCGHQWTTVRIDDSVSDEGDRCD